MTCVSLPAVAAVHHPRHRQLHRLGRRVSSIVLIVYSDLKVQPVTLHDQIAAEPDVVTVDYFDAKRALPRSRSYNRTTSSSPSPTARMPMPWAWVTCWPTTPDAGGTVVAFNFDCLARPSDWTGVG